MPNRRWIAAVVVSAVVTACGSTVPPAEQAAAPSSELNGAPIQTDSAATIDSSASAQATARTDTKRAAGSTRATTAGRTTVDTARRGTLGPIKIGALTAQGAGEFQESLGFTGAKGDQVAMTKAVVGYINSNGGIGGRQIEVVHYDLDPNDEVSDPGGAYQAACAAFTEDNKVVAVASILSVVPDSFYQCLEKAGVIVVVPGEATSSRFFQRHPSSVYMPSSPTYTRLLSSTVDALWARGWLTANSKVGVVGMDTPDSRATVDDGLIPALKRHGLTLSETRYTSTDSSLAADYPGAVLRFKSNNIDRVFFAPGGQPIYFALAAEAQAYRPRYALGSLEYPYLLTQNLPASQLSGSAGLGWIPYFDVDASRWQKTPTPGLARCTTALKAAQQDLSNGTVLGIASWICDDWFFLQDALQRTSTISPASVRQAVESMGRAFSPSSTFATRFGPGQLHDGAAAYRLNVFDDGCRCYTYASGDTVLP